MKSVKIILLGIAFMVFGGVLKVLTLGYMYPHFLDWIMNISFFLGVIITVVGFFISDNP